MLPSLNAVHGKTIAMHTLEIRWVCAANGVRMDAEVYNEGYKYGLSIASMSNREANFVKNNPDKDNEGPRFIKSDIDGFIET